MQLSDGPVAKLGGGVEPPNSPSPGYGSVGNAQECYHQENATADFIPSQQSPFL